MAELSRAFVDDLREQFRLAIDAQHDERVQTLIDALDEVRPHFHSMRMHTSASLSSGARSRFDEELSVRSGRPTSSEVVPGLRTPAVLLHARRCCRACFKSRPPVLLFRPIGRIQGTLSHKRGCCQSHQATCRQPRVRSEGVCAMHSYLQPSSAFFSLSGTRLSYGGTYDTLT
jgi:hypothetical protein